jgi:uncharacterized OB-fold protein
VIGRDAGVTTPAPNRVAAQDGLFDVACDPPVLLGTRCRGCDGTFFPPLGVGCEICGAPQESLRPAPLRTAGRLQAFATVYRHPGRDIETPFTVAEIELDDGPIVRALMDTPTDDDLTVNDRVTGTWIGCGATEQGEEIVDLRFTVKETRS